MKPRVICCAAAILATMTTEPFAETLPPACDMQQAHPLADRSDALARYEQLPQYCLKAMFMQCAAQANEQVLDFGSAAACSIGYEALLKRGFSGDFQALMAWWRTQRDADSATN